MSVPNTFASATSAIPLANLDADFAYYDAAFQIVGTAMEVNYTFRLEDPTDNTKKAEFVMSGITTGTTRQYTLPNVTGSLASLGNISQTFTGSTSIVPTTNGSAITIGAIPQTGTITLGRSTAAQTVDIAVGATAAATTKTVNIGTTGVSTSITNINLGSAISGAVNNIVLNGSQINSVPYLNTSRILTTGTVLRFDGETLGVGVAPDSWDTATYRAMQIAKSGAVYSSVSSNSISMSANTRFAQPDGFYYLYSGLASDYTQINGTHIWSRAVSGTTNDIISFIPSMTLDASGNLGLGTTSPSSRLHIQSATPVLTIQDTTSAAGGVGGTINFIGYTSGITGANVEAQIKGVKSSANAAGELRFYTSDSAGTSQQRAMIDGSGNLGLGVTPSAWYAGANVFQFKTATLLSNGTNNSTFIHNAYFDTAWRYIVTGQQASQYSQTNGAHVWNTAPSGTAGNAITFTQAMTLHASGGLSLGNTTDPGAGVMTGKAFQGNGAAWTGTSGNVQTTNPPSSSGVWTGWNKSGGFAEANLVYGGAYLEIGRWNGTTYTAQAYLDSAGNLGLGGGANASAILDAQSTTKGVRMPNMTTTQKNAISSPAAGLMVFDTTLAKLCVYSGSAWQTITSI